jgi:hypothetical protein
MQVIVKVTMWDIEGERYVGAASPGHKHSYVLVTDPALAVRFNLCGAAWEAFGGIAGLGNVQAASLVEVN